MHKAIDLVKQISKDLSKDWKEELSDYNMPDTFINIYSSFSIQESNSIICYIVYSYSPESLFLDLKKDRFENKFNILNKINPSLSDDTVQDILYNRKEIIGMAIFDFLDGLKSWKWRAIFDLLDYSSKMFRFATQETDAEKSFQKVNKEGTVQDIKIDYDIDVIAKVNKEKGLLLEQAIAKRKQADALLEEIKKDFVLTDNATQGDFGFSFTETAKKKDILSWRQYIQERNQRKQVVAN